MTGSAAALAIVGPTASGKTALSLAVARRLAVEIVSMDSRQLYRGMDIGTAKATPEQRARVPHHGLDLIEPDQRFSAGTFARQARSWIQEIAGRGRTPLLVGGTGFFLRALTNPIFREPPLDADRRRALQAHLQRFDESRLLAWLHAHDPESAARLARWGGRQRLMRALEIPLLTGRTLPWWHRNAPPEAPPVPVTVFALDVPRPALNASIEARVGAMVELGLIQEVRSLLRRGYDEHDPGMNATGYIELIPALRGEREMEEALDLVRKHTRAYAKRQMTWFRHQLPRGTVWLDATRPSEELADEIGRRWSAARAGRPGRSATPPNPEHT
jgi:tRNA dimethylallyltransferase